MSVLLLVIRIVGSVFACILCIPSDPEGGPVVTSVWLSRRSCSKKEWGRKLSEGWNNSQTHRVFSQLSTHSKGPEDLYWRLWNINWWLWGWRKRRVEWEDFSKVCARPRKEEVQPQSGELKRSSVENGSCKHVVLMFVSTGITNRKETILADLRSRDSGPLNWTGEEWFPNLLQVGTIWCWYYQENDKTMMGTEKWEDKTHFKAEAEWKGKDS